MRRATLAGGLGLALCLTAASFAAAPLYVPGLALLLIAAFAVAWVSVAVRHVSLQRSIGSTAVEEQAPLLVTVHVARSRLPLPGAELRAWPGAPAHALPRSHDAIVTATARFPRRGRRPLGSASLLVSDPLGICGRRVFSTADEVLVLPRVEPVSFFEGGGEADALGWTRRSSTELAATEVDSLRPHRPETPASRIHWPTVARTMTLMERRLVADADQRPLVVVDRATLPAATLSTRPSAPARRCACTWPAKAAARCCFPAIAGRRRLTRTCMAGRSCTRGSRS